MRISIIIPLYDKSAYIERALASIAAQTLTDYEVIVVDDGSRDDGPDKVRRWNDGRVRLVQQPNAGPGAARNRGIREAGADLLAFLDADDEWTPTYLAQSVRHLERHPDAVSITSGYFEWPAGISREPYWRGRGLTPGRNRWTAETSPVLAVDMLAYMCPWSTVVRTDVVRALGGFFDKERCLYAEDAHLWLKVLLNHPVAFNLDPLVRFHTEASGLSKNLTKARPVEPFLEHPQDIEAVCPTELRSLLGDILALRAFKTACVLGYWGRWRDARRLRSSFQARQPWRLPYSLASLVCSTPVGAWLGAVHRLLRRR